MRDSQRQLSIIIPVYNCEKYLEECLESCVNQDIDSKCYEIICVDDGSIDSGIAVLTKYQKNYENIFVIKQSNQGVAKARNNGLEHANGEYIWFVDADDFIEENILSDIIRYAQQTSCDRMKVLSYCFTDRLSGVEKERKELGRLVPNYPYKDTQITRTIIKKTYIEKHRIQFCETLSYGEDTIFNYQTRLYHPVDVILNRIGYYYRKHKNAATALSSSDEIKRKAYIQSCRYAIGIVAEDYNSNRYSHRIVKQMLEYWIKTMLEQYYYLGRIDDSYSWNGKRIRIHPFDVKLRRLNALCTTINESREISVLTQYVIRMLDKKQKEQNRKRKRKELKGFIKKGNWIYQESEACVKNKIYHKTTFSWKNKKVWIHLILFFTTAGIGNIIYLMYGKKK